MAIRFVPIFLFSFSIVFMQCKSNFAQTSKPYDSLVTSRFGNEYEEEFNTAKTFSLVESKDSANGRKEFNYAVIDLNNNEVVLEGKYNRGGYVKWLNDGTIEHLSIPKHVTVIPDSAMYKRQIFIDKP